MELAVIIETLAPWLGGGAVTVAAGLTVWLWLQYHKREGSQWDRNHQLLADTQRDRDYWRQMAIDRQKEINHLQDLIKEVRRRNDELARQNKLLEAQVDILRQKAEAL